MKLSILTFAGKSFLLQASIEREAQAIVAKAESGVLHCIILCVWQAGADALMEQFKDLEKNLPKAENLETMVLSKEELLRKFMVNDHAGETTSYQINAVCKNISRFTQGKQVHLYIDECWISVPTVILPHLTLVSSAITACHLS